MGVCPDCGRPCTACSKRSSISLKAVDKSIREVVEAFLKDIKATRQQQDWVVQRIKQHKTNHVRRAIRTWLHQGYGKKGYSEHYFMGILSKIATAPSERLDSLPPELED
jgi:hypothetical protein